MRKVNKEIFEKFMQDRKLTKTAFCRNCGISIKTFNNLLQGRNVSIVSVVKIADYTDIKIHAMFS